MGARSRRRRDVSAETCDWRANTRGFGRRCGKPATRFIRHYHIRDRQRPVCSQHWIEHLGRLATMRANQAHTTRED